MEILSDVGGEALVEDALQNLVHQFARPLDCLRELVQNSMDAGSPRVEVWIGRCEGDAALDTVELHVDDWGEGMDQRIIEGQLTRIYSSSKEGDLTKIGKFGIGFTSIFAMSPRAVLLRTGRHGESWELLFHEDRSYDMVRLDAPVEGTKITLFVRVPETGVHALVEGCRETLRHWCEHAPVPITFEDRTGQVGSTSGEVSGDDPFGAFEDTAGDEGGAELIPTPMDIEADLKLTAREGRIELIVAYSGAPEWVFYNHGLTLLRTRHSHDLGDYAPRLQNLSFKVRSNALEHTLTRDSVLRDDAWREAMEALVELAEQLRVLLVADTERRSGAALSALHARIAAECRSAALQRRIPDFDDRVWLLDSRGGRRTLAEVHRAARDEGVALVDTGCGVADALAEAGALLLPQDPELHELLHATWPVWPWARVRRAPLALADQVYVRPQVLPREALLAEEASLMDSASEYVLDAIGERLALGIGDFGGAQEAMDEPLFLVGSLERALFRREPRSWLRRQARARLPVWMSRRTLLFNRHHPTFQVHAHDAARDPAVAAVSLVCCALVDEGRESPAVLSALLEAARRTA